MKIVFSGYLIKDIEIIKRHLEKEKKGVTLSHSDAARWAISKQADEIRQANKNQ